MWAESMSALLTLYTQRWAQHLAQSRLQDTTVTSREIWTSFRYLNLSNSICRFVIWSWISAKAGTSLEGCIDLLASCVTQFTFPAVVPRSVTKAVFGGQEFSFDCFTAQCVTQQQERCAGSVHVWGMRLCLSVITGLCILIIRLLKIAKWRKITKWLCLFQLGITEKDNNRIRLLWFPQSHWTSWEGFTYLQHGDILDLWRTMCPAVVLCAQNVLLRMSHSG